MVTTAGHLRIMCVLMRGMVYLVNVRNQDFNAVSLLFFFFFWRIGKSVNSVHGVRL